MPYIAPEERRLIDAQMHFINVEVMTKGQVNYLLSCLVARWVRVKGRSYHSLSEGHGLLQDATAEYYRRVMAPYEDQKIAENGDVYENLL